MTQPLPTSVERPSVEQTGRLEAFSDGVLAVIITIMALELRVPTGGSFEALDHRLPALLIYVLSFTFIGIYWNNHLLDRGARLHPSRPRHRPNRRTPLQGCDRSRPRSERVAVDSDLCDIGRPRLCQPVDLLVVTVAIIWFVPDRRLTR
jgi:hypothetical protein